MNVLHVSSDYSRGGAAHSLRLLHHALIAAGHGSKVLVGRPTEPQPSVAVIPPLPWWGRISYHGLNLTGLNYVGIPTTFKILEHPFLGWADVVHYHNLHGGFFNYLALPALTRAKPSVWTLRDMWGLTGHCAHSFDCDRWRTGCGRCPYPEVDPPIRRDATRWEWKLKLRTYQRARLQVTAPSRLLADLARQSMLGCQPVTQVHNAVDTTVFVPRDRAQVRAELGWPPDLPVLLFAAESLDNPFKDFRLLLQALRQLPTRRRAGMVLAMLGSAAAAHEDLADMRTLSLGYQDSERTLARIYAAADLFVYPTRADNQPRVLLEAMACGCPPVATDVGGVSELVAHEQTGLLVKPGDADGLCRAIEYLLDDPSRRERLARNGHRLVTERHGVEQHVTAMLSIYAAACRDHTKSGAA